MEMKQFIVRKVVGNEYTTLGVYQQKETAMQEGKRLFAESTEKCRVTCIRAEIDEEGNIDKSRYELFNMWW